MRIGLDLHVFSSLMQGSRSHQDIASVVERLLASPQECSGLRRKGLTRAAVSSWDKTPRATLVAYEQAREDRMIS